MLALTLEEEWVVFQLCYDYDLYRVLQWGIILYVANSTVSIN
jgi:hypothetical protein